MRSRGQAAGSGAQLVAGWSRGAAANHVCHNHRLPVDPQNYWFDSLPGRIDYRARLTGEIAADVAIIGAGFTGLWTAHYLKQQDPSCRVVLLEAETAGFGASGRNGGWCSAAHSGLATLYGRDRGAARALELAMFDTVDEVGRASAALSIDCDYHKGGMLSVASTPEEAHRIQQEVAHRHSQGQGEKDYRWLSPAESEARIRSHNNLGAMYSPHCAALHPAKLARGLATAVEDLGAEIYEDSRVLRVEKGRVETAEGRVRAPHVVVATEGFTAQLHGYERCLLPVYSYILATEPLAEEAWQAIGIADRETFADARRLFIYCQRTADDRLVLGGTLGYFYGSGIQPSNDRDATKHASVEARMREFLPATRDLSVTHRWGGPIGMPRDFMPSVGLDRNTGLAWGYGYVGDGVATTNLAGRTLADLLLGRESALTALPWVGHRSPRWMAEPFRWLAIEAVNRSVNYLDEHDAGTGGLLANLLSRFVPKL
jgi:glycine/D-amino acid oxidase-like deaminating enzyme